MSNKKSQRKKSQKKTQENAKEASNVTNTHQDTGTPITSIPAPISFGDQFDSLSHILSPEILAYITQTLHHTHLTPIQQSSIPLLLSNKDIVAEAVTGSGKTLAYLIPLVQIVQEYESQRLSTLIKAKAADDDVQITRKIRGIVICPTRELAKQVFDIAKGFEASIPELEVLLVSGGVERQSNFEQYSMLVATPGRLLELMLKKHVIGLDLSSVEMLVLDEADKILEMGFDTQVNAILRDLPSQRRTALFSATQTKDMYKWIKAGLRNPVRIAVKVKRNEDQKSQATPLQLQNFYMVCGYDVRLNQLLHFLQQYANKKVIVYFYTCACVEYFYLVLSRLKQKGRVQLPKLYELHGQIKNKKRRQILDKYREAKEGILLSTDVTARGIDMPNISIVVQFDPPRDPQSYVHRVGRSARMGSSGSSLLFLSPEEDGFSDYLKGKKIPISEIEPYEEVHDYIADVKALTMQDRELWEKSEEALKSFARGYKEHQLTYIFDKKKLNYDDLCVGFCMLRKPPVDQLLTHKFRKFKWDGDLDVEKIPYANAAQEKARLKRLSDEKKKAKSGQNDSDEEGEAPSHVPTAGIHKELVPVTQFKEMRTELRADRSIRTRKKKRIYQKMVQEEVNYEKLLLKKVKRGKISEKDYERLTGEAYFMDKIDGFTVDMDDETAAMKNQQNSKKRKRKKSSKRGGGQSGEELQEMKRLKLDWLDE